MFGRRGLRELFDCYGLFKRRERRDG